jgi:hypothetical protein
VIRRPAARALAAAIAMLASAGARAWDPFPARTGGSGMLDVPDADVMAAGAVKLSANLAAERDAAATSRLFPLPLAAALGLGPISELGFGLRQGGAPGDPTPSPTLFSVGYKRRFRAAEGKMPALAFQLRGDRVNWDPAWGARVVASTVPAGRFQLAGFAGLDMGAGWSMVPGIGAAGSLVLDSRLTLLGQLLASTEGFGVGTAVRWKVATNVGGIAGLDWTDAALRFTVGFAIATPPPRPKKKPGQIEEAPPEAPREKRFLDDGPRFRMRITPGDESGGDHEHYEQPPPTGTTLRAARTARAPEAQGGKRREVTR